MFGIAQASTAIIFVGLLVLMVGYSARDNRAGPALIGTGVVLLLSAIAHHIVRTLQ